MKKIILLFLGFVFISNGCTFDECTSKSLYLAAFDNFIDKTEKNYSNYNDKDWKVADERFEKLTEECFKKFEDDFSDEDKKKIAKFGIKYALYRVKSELPLKINIDNEDLKEFIDDISGLVDKEEDITKILEKIKDNKSFNEAAKDFKSGIKNLEKGLNKFGKELEKIFDDFNKEVNK